MGLKFLNLREKKERLFCESMKIGHHARSVYIRAKPNSRFSCLLFGPHDLQPLWCPRDLMGLNNNTGDLSSRASRDSRKGTAEIQGDMAEEQNQILRT